MLVRKRVEMWHAVQSEDKPGVWVLTDCNGKIAEISDEEFDALYERVPDRHISRGQKGTQQEIVEALKTDGEVQTGQ